jgi:hypothetical protein
MKEEVLKKGPLAMMFEKAVLIFASTPPYNYNPCQKIIDGVYEGEKIAEYLNFELTCPECKPIVEIDRNHQCDHRLGWRPAMHDPEVIGIAKAACGDDDTFQREFMSTVISSADQYINNKYLEHMANSDWFEFKKPPDYIFVSVDPATNGMDMDGVRSFCAFVTCCMVDGVAVVIYIYIHIRYMFL